MPSGKDTTLNEKAPHTGCFLFAGKSHREFDEISVEECVSIIRQGHMPTSSRPAIGEEEALYNTFAGEEFLNLAMAPESRFYHPGRSRLHGSSVHSRIKKNRDAMHPGFSYFL